MKNYLSFGGGVNSVAMMLYLLDEGWDFEAVFVNHGTDWPETYEYLEMFQGWLEKNGHGAITVLRPDVEGFDNLYDFCEHKGIVPSKMFRWCTDKFKVKVLARYYKKPCFNLLGIDMGEAKRAKLNYNKNIENRFPLIEAGMDRQSCKEYIIKKGLPIPIKSGCYICPFQSPSQVIQLRKEKAELFCKAESLENKAIKNRKLNGKEPIYLFGSGHGKPIRAVVEENQRRIFKQDEYPPCECML